MREGGVREREKREPGKRRDENGSRGIEENFNSLTLVSNKHRYYRLT